MTALPSVFPGGFLANSHFSENCLGPLHTLYIFPLLRAQPESCLKFAGKGTIQFQGSTSRSKEQLGEISNQEKSALMKKEKQQQRMHQLPPGLQEQLRLRSTQLPRCAEMKG